MALDQTGRQTDRQTDRKTHLWLVGLVWLVGWVSCLVWFQKDISYAWFGWEITDGLVWVGLTDRQTDKHSFFFKKLTYHMQTLYVNSCF